MARLALTFLFLLSPVAVAALGQRAEVLQEARGLIAEDDREAAIRLLENLPPDSLGTAGYLLLGLAYQGVFQHEQALAMLARADTSDVRVLAATGQSLDQMGRTREAAARYAEAYRQDSTNQRVALSLAKLYADLKQWDQAPPIYQRLLQEDDRNAFVHAQLATAYRALDSTEAAIVHYEIARQLNPRSLSVVLALSSVYLQTERAFSAKRVVDAALAEQPEEPLLWQRDGDIALRDEDYDRAATSFKRALTLGDSTALNLRNFGVSLYLAGDYGDSFEPLRAAFAADSMDAMTAFYLGMVYQQRAEYGEALALLETATDLMGRTMMAEAFTQIAATYDRMDEDAEAIRTYRLVQGLNPDKTDVLFHLAALYDTYYADPSSALRHYTEFLDLVDEGQFADMQSHARERVAALREAAFFRDGGAALHDTLTSDTTGAAE